MTERYYYKHYIRTREDGCITEGWSDGPHNTRTVTEDDILLNDKGGYQFCLFPGGEENPPLYTMDRIPLYRWDGTAVSRRSEAEIEADRQARSIRRADRDYEPGEYLTMDGTMYKVLLPIFAGAQITPGTNTEATTIEAEMALLKKEDN